MTWGTEPTSECASTSPSGPGPTARSAFFNNITYTAPKVPTLYTALTAGDMASNPTVYGGYTNTFVLEKGQVVQITVNNLDSGRHPFHLHGHHFQAIYRSSEEAGTFSDANVTEDSFPRIPMRRDTLLVYPQGNIVLRFRADNPGTPKACSVTEIQAWIVLIDPKTRGLAVSLPHRMARCIGSRRHLRGGPAGFAGDPHGAPGPL